MLSLGKVNRLRRCATSAGKFVMLALDHRGNLRRAMAPDDPDSVSYAMMAAFKRELTRALSPFASGILLDPQYGLATAVASGAIDPGSGLLVAVEKTGYTGDPTARESQILPDWGVEKIARVGAAGVKLLVYYHPDAPTAGEQEALVQEVGEACRRYDIPYFLEPLSFSLDPEVKRLQSAEKRRVVVETARRLTPLGVDVLKAEFPVQIDEEADREKWLDACRELSGASEVPWVLLSAGVNFEQFAEQTRVSCEAGASGVLAGRAVWKEAVDLQGQARQQFYQTTGRERLEELQQIVDTHGRPWTDFYPDLESQATAQWYRHY